MEIIQDMAYLAGALLFFGLTAVLLRALDKL